MREADLVFNFFEVEYQTRRTETGCDCRVINPKATVPARRFVHGELLTEEPRRPIRLVERRHCLWSKI